LLNELGVTVSNIDKVRGQFAAKKSLRLVSVLCGISQLKDAL
jgi:hypothetical protein